MQGSQRPERDAPIEQWTAWADKHYPFDPSVRSTARGFDVIRSEDHPEMRGMMARALCIQFPEPYRGHPAGVPPMPDFGYGNMPQQPLFGDEEGIEE